MAEIFLSYASQDRDRIRPLVEALQADGFDVWWDRDLRPGPSFDLEIEKAIDAAACMVVVWSEHAIASEWVRSEVEEGVRRGMLVPVLIDPVLPPLAYRRRQTADLTDWRGGRDAEYQQLLAGIRATLEAAPRAADGTPRVEIPRRRRLRWPRIGPVTFATTCLLVLAAGAYLGMRVAPDTGAAESEVVRFDIRLSADQVLLDEFRFDPITVSRDGRRIILGVRRGVEEIYLVRSVDGLEAETVPEEVGNLGSLWADWRSDSVIFSREDGLWRIGLDGAGRRRVFDVDDERGEAGSAWGASWSEDGTLAVAFRYEGIFLLPPGDASPQQLTTPEEGAQYQYPSLFDDGRKLLYSKIEARRQTRPQIRVRDLETGDDRALLAGMHPILTPTGHLLYVDGGTVHGVAFDPDRGETRGSARALFDVRMSAAGLAPAGFALSPTGTLAYTPPPSARRGAVALGWLDRSGHYEPIDLRLEYALSPRLSPDDGRIALSGLTRAQLDQGDGSDLWIHDLTERRSSRLSFDDGSESWPAWTRDGRDLLYASAESTLLVASSHELFRRRADGAGAGEPLTNGAWIRGAIVPTLDGEQVLLQSCPGGGRCRIVRRALDADGPIELVIDRSSSITEPALSRDGRWLAYVSSESGRPEVYVHPYPDVDAGRWQVSSNGGVSPVWSRGDDRLFFVEPVSEQLMAIRYSADGPLNSETPERFRDLTGYSHADPTNSYRNFDLDRAGERVLIGRRPEPAQRIVVVVNWFEELERLVPTK